MAKRSTNLALTCSLHTALCPALPCLQGLLLRAGHASQWAGTYACPAFAAASASLESAKAVLQYEQAQMEHEGGLLLAL